MSDFITLKNAVDSWLIRDDLAVDATNMPIITLLAESEIARDLRTVMQEGATTLNFTGRSVDLPYDFLELKRVFIDDNIRKTEYMTPEAIRESSEWQRGRSGAFYTVERGTQTAGDERLAITIASAASAASPLDMEVVYWARFPALSGDSDTNWLLANHFDIYLYAMLRAACEFIQEDQLEDRYRGKYDAAVAKLNKHENRKRHGAQTVQRYASPRGVV